MAMLQCVTNSFDICGTELEQDPTFELQWAEHCLDMNFKRLQLKEERKKRPQQRDTMPNYVLGSQVSGKCQLQLLMPSSLTSNAGYADLFVVCQ